MSTRSCPRLFEAEAIRDGRLNGAERASFERHAANCAACAYEVDVLQAVNAALRATRSVGADELHVRREQTRLLAAFDRELVAPGRAAFVSRRTYWLVAVATIATALVLWRAREDEGWALPAGTPRAIVHAEGVATWSERMERGREVVTLERGALSIHVLHDPGARRLLVVLPDGELEDTGTTFTISVEDGRTTRVDVREGSVLLRLHGRPSIAIPGGDVWTDEVSRSPATTPPGQSAATSEPPKVAPPPAVTPNPLPRAMGAITSSARDPSADFQAAVSALHHGYNREAADVFASFLANHSRDPRTEDAAYLRVIALQRCGDRAGMQAAAASYLRRYPTGFRHAEIEPLTR